MSGAQKCPRHTDEYYDLMQSGKRGLYWGLECRLMQIISTHPVQPALSLLIASACMLKQALDADLNELTLNTFIKQFVSICIMFKEVVPPTLLK